jgi:hypothetical protein
MSLTVTIAEDGTATLNASNVAVDSIIDNRSADAIAASDTPAVVATPSDDPYAHLRAAEAATEAAAQDEAVAAEELAQPDGTTAAPPVIPATWDGVERRVDGLVDRRVSGPVAVPLERRVSGAADRRVAVTSTPSTAGL